MDAEPVSTWNPTSLVRVFSGRRGGATQGGPSREVPPKQKLPPEAATAAHHPCRYRLKYRRHGHRAPGDSARRLYNSLIRSRLPLESLMAIMFGCCASSATISTGI